MPGPSEDRVREMYPEASIEHIFTDKHYAIWNVDRTVNARRILLGLGRSREQAWKDADKLVQKLRREQ